MRSKKIRSLYIGVLTALASVAFLPATGSADQFPSKPVNIIVPYSAGSPADVLARRLGDGMSTALETPVIVENAAGAGGVTGTLKALRVEPDGHTLLIGTQGTMMMNKFIYNSLKYDPDADFIPVVNLVSFPNLVLASPSLGVSTLQQFIALAKKNSEEGDPLKYGSGGVGSSAHLAAELLKLEADIDLTHVPYKSVADTATDLLSGRIDIVFGSVGTFASHVEAGTLTGLALTAPKRSTVLPNIPTIGEAGYPDAEFAVWLGLFAPANTPEDAIGVLREAAIASMTIDNTRDAFASEGAEIQATSSTDFAEFIEADSTKWKPIIERLGIEIN